MSEHSLEQSLSALMDGESSELELQRILKNLDNPNVRQQWQNMQRVRAVMHREPFVAVDVSAGVMAALEGVGMDAAEQAEPKATSSWKGWQRMAVAASVTLAVLGGVRFYNQAPTDATPELVQTTAPAQQVAPAYLSERPVILASYNAQDAQLEQEREQENAERSSQWHREQLPLYLKQHAQQSSVGGVLPYARAASMEGR